jgi:micrococcal nuclease
MQKKWIALCYVIIFSLFGLVFSFTPHVKNNNFTNQFAEASDVDKTKIDTETIEEENLNAKKTEQLANKQVELASKVSKDIKFEDGIGAQDIKSTIAKNKEIAAMGNSTKGTKMFYVSEVLDADTFVLEGFGTVKLIGVSAPNDKIDKKAKQCYANEAIQKAKNQLLHKKVYLEFDENQRIDTYGRTMAYVYEENDNFYNYDMIKSGTAYTYRAHPHKLFGMFSSAENQAIKENAGLWNKKTCDGRLNYKAERYINVKS